ncbi:hypothetical protein BKA67DRAFT_579138 [Truncatella angustata]|uniref:Uncharacterized protein n=1 Tax=Truncatella angustata TaxID=152316 RepID=A0A9P8UDL5_9PEZI|nr:uncharacterized protein BKA67DRAFT_579138 [Truncatella angustata]KAH6647983.1 hypothetical protein BKA67DRAFT_579138 [Truncatella angustata]
MATLEVQEACKPLQRLPLRSAIILDPFHAYREVKASKHPETLPPPQSRAGSSRLPSPAAVLLLLRPVGGQLDNS